MSCTLTLLPHKVILAHLILAKLRSLYLTLKTAKDIGDIAMYTPEEDEEDYYAMGLPNNQLALEVIETPQNSQGTPPQLYDSQLQSIHPEFPLPLQTDNETVDIDLIKLRDYPGEDIIPFQEWCDTKHIHSQMVKKKWFFGLNDKFESMKRTNPLKALALYQAWTASFQTHNQPFDQWIHSGTTPDIKEPPQPLAQDNTIKLPEWHMKAFEYAEQAPRSDRIKLHKLRRMWAMTIIRNHSLTFPEWLKSTLSPTEDKLDIDQQDKEKVSTMIDVKPYSSTFYYQQTHALEDRLLQAEFILDKKAKQHLDRSATFPASELFQPDGPLARFHIPNYIYVPYSLAVTLQVGDIIQHNHVQHLIWTRLLETQYAAYMEETDQWQKYFQDHPELHCTPLIIQFMQQTPVDKPQITLRQVVQQMQAHARCKELGGPGHFTKDDFYDLFVRPLEFLVCRGMPLHALMLRSIHSMEQRCNFFRQIIEIAGFSSYDNIPLGPHYLFAEISKIRHLEPQTLIPQNAVYITPLARLDNLPRIPSLNQTRKMLGEISQKDFERHGKLHGITPHPYLPIPTHILDTFPHLGGRHIPLRDHIALNYEMIRCYKIFANFQQRPTPAPRRQLTYDKEEKGHTPPPRRDNKHTRPDSKSSTEIMETSLEEPKQEPSRSTTNTPKMKQKSIKLTTAQMIEKTSIPESPSPPKKMSSSPAPDNTVIHMTVNQLQQLLKSKETSTSGNRTPITKQESKQPEVVSSPELPSFKQTPASKTTDNQYGAVLPAQQPLPKKAADTLSTSSTIYPTPAYHPSISTRPEWIQRAREQIDQKVFPSSLIWSCTGHYITPTWAKVAHSAYSLYNIVDKESPMDEGTKARHRQMPQYRRIPADGLNHIHDFTVHFEATRHAEYVLIQIDSQLYKNYPDRRQTQLEQPVRRRMTIPTHIFNRFIIQFYDIADHQMRPAFQDVQQEGYNLLKKTCYILDYQITYDISIHEGQNGLERLVTLNMQKGNIPRRQITPTLMFPWVRMGAILTAMREVLTDMQQSGLV